MVRPLLARRCSWPPCQPAGGAGECGAGAAGACIQPECGSGETESSLESSGADRKRRIASIFQHYYPEGETKPGNSDFVFVWKYIISR